MNLKLIGNIEKRKEHGFKRFLKSFKYSYDGLKYAYLNEQSLLIHVLLGFIVIVLGLYLKISDIEWLLVFMYIGLVMATELINTSIEATIDLVTEEYHELAKIAKDTASAAVLVFSIVASIGGLVIFLPKILELL